VSDAYSLGPVGHVVGGRDVVRDDDWGAERATIRLDGERFTPDATAGTPVLDIKPYMNELGPQGDVRQPAWASELMAGYW
jgi:hypothetical protein